MDCGGDYTRRLGYTPDVTPTRAMASQHDDDLLPYGLRERVLEGLGLSSALSRDLGGLHRLYRAWCHAVPFDNVRKMIALRTMREGRLPGIAAEDFFESWLAHGTGGTCWPTSQALYALLDSVGFDARRVAGSMRDAGVVNHGSVKVRLAGLDWLVDSSSLTNVPLPLDGHVFVSREPLIPAEVEAADGTHVVWVHTPPNSSHLPCRLLVDPADYATYEAGYESSRERSPFNQRLYARRNHPDELVVLVGCTRFSKTVDGLAKRDLSPTELCQSLASDIGLSPGIISQWVECGALEASFEPPAGPKPPALTQVAPSKRQEWWGVRFMRRGANTSAAPYNASATNSVAACE